MAEAGFEFAGEFYPWSVSDGAKDLILIDRFTGMPVTDFFAAIEDDVDRGRAPILLALMATSMRAKHPDRSPERIGRAVEGLSLSQVEFIDGDEQEGDDGPPAVDGGTQPSVSPGSDSSEDESK
jgi:hypothetical protein